jgi:hypothetical protein
MLVALSCQFALGIAANLYTTIPAHHPGAHPHNYFSGSVSSLGWALAHSGLVLAAHAVLGIVLVVLALAATITAWRSSGRGVAVLMGVGALSVIGAGFNGASFLDFANDVSSLIMALLCALALLAYSVALYLSASPSALVRER